MIIYKRKKKQLVIPCGLGPVVCPETGYDLQAKTVDSSTVLQIVEPDSGYYGMYRVTVNPLTDNNLLPGNIKAGVEILGVLGTYAGELIRLQAKQVDPSTNQLTVTADASYDGLSIVTVNAVTAAIDPDIQAGNIKKDVEILGVIGTFEGGSLGTKTVNSSTVSQTVTPDAGDYGLSSVTVNPYTAESKSETITENGQYTFNPSTADTLLSVTVDVSVAGGSTINNQDKTVDSSTLSQSITCDNGYTGLGTVTVNPYRLRSKSYTLTQNISSITLTPGEGYDGLSDATVTVSITGEDVSANITQNGSYSYTSSDPYNLLNRVDISVNVPGGTLDTKTVDSSTVSQTVTPNSGDYGLSSVVVNPYTLESKSATLTANGQYTYTATNADALSSVTVDVSIKSAPDLQSKTVNSSTSSQTVTPDASYDGLSSVQVNPYVLDSSTVDPSTNQITVTSTEDGLSSVTVNAVTSSIDNNIAAGNIKSGVTILGVQGTYAGQVINNQNKTVDSSTVSQSVTFDSGYTGLGTVTVNPYTLQQIDVFPEQYDQTINPSAGYDGISSVWVMGRRLQSKNVDASTMYQIIRADTDQGYWALSSVTVNGTMLDSSTVNASTSQQIITPASGYYALSSVTVNAVTSSIDNNITAGNIKNGVTILGVQGTYSGETTNYDNIYNALLEI